MKRRFLVSTIVSWLLMLVFYELEYQIGGIFVPLYYISGFVGAVSFAAFVWLIVKEFEKS